ncbi:Transmembrane protein 53 [Aphanomyces cochlioides]|nr:Transmembrane protein 53 [Aphanomyces cochlioides]
MYNKLGYRTLMLPSHGLDFFLPERWVHMTAIRQVEQIVKDQNNAPLEIIPHVLSNGGCRSWYCFENQLIHAGIPFRVASIVFDSCPSIPGPTSESPFTMMQLQQIPLLKLLVTERFMWRWIIFALHALLWLTGRKHPFTLHYLRYLIRDASIPKLFLYSSADELVGSADIQGAIQTARSMGSPFASVDFEVSKHVSHYRTNPALYMSTVQTFLSKHVR